MTLKLRIAAICLLGLSVTVWAFEAYDTYGAPDSDAKHEFAWSRLRYTSAAGAFGGLGFGYGYGYGGGRAWSRDYPKADIVFLAALRRLTRVDARSYQQVVDLDSDAIFNFPFVYAVQVQTWSFSDAQAKRRANICSKAAF